MGQRKASIAKSRYADGALALLAVLAAVPACAEASVATQLGGMFSITPARHYLVARPPVRLTPTRVANTTQNRMSVQVIPVLLTQLPSGAFSFDLSPQGLRTAAHLLSAGPRRFDLSPGGSRDVGLRWRGLPPHARTANAGVIYQAVPALSSTPVRIVERLLGIDIFRLPGHYRFTGALDGMHVEQARPGVLRFVLDARNTGQAVSGPSRLSLTVHNDTGARLLYSRITPDILLPGAWREFTLDLKQRLPAGSYTAIGHMAFGSSHRLKAMTSFHLVAPNQLASYHLRVGSLVAQGTVGGSAHVSTDLRNTGTAPGTSTITLTLYRLVNGLPRPTPAATRRLTIGSLAPGHSSHLQDGLGHLKQGTYRLLAYYHDAEGAPHTLIADFQAQQPLGLFARLRAISREHPLLIPLLLILLNCSILMLMLIRERYLKHTLNTVQRQIIELR